MPPKGAADKEVAVNVDTILSKTKTCFEAVCEILDIINIVLEIGVIVLKRYLAATEAIITSLEVRVVALEAFVAAVESIVLVLKIADVVLDIGVIVAERVLAASEVIVTTLEVCIIALEVFLTAAESVVLFLKIIHILSPIPGRCVPAGGVDGLAHDGSVGSISCVVPPTQHGGQLPDCRVVNASQHGG